MSEFCGQPWSIGSDETFSWRIRLEIERQFRNITAAHQRIIGYVADMADAGSDQLSHAEIGRALHYHRNTVKDALRRGGALGLLTWRRSYRLVASRPQRQANIYSRAMPQGPARARPEIRRRHKDTLCPARNLGTITHTVPRIAHEQALAALAARRQAVERALVNRFR